MAAPSIRAVSRPGAAGAQPVAEAGRHARHGEQQRRARDGDGEVAEPPPARPTAAASTGSARPPVSSACSRSTAETP